ncbi:hypothetical protein NQZ68_034845 [Dissostichus eleginoides]|nr:hypothetical protein NQZ68_034845 [Dissostichus eleginoides]
MLQIGEATKFDDQLYQIGIQRAVRLKGLRPEDTIETPSVTFKGTLYKIGMAVVVHQNDMGYKFGKIEDLDKKGKRLLEFFRSQLMKCSMDVKAVLKEALKEDREGTDGDTMWSANKWMLSIEGRVVIPLSPPMPDFTTALVVLFASFYVFNIEYEVEAVTMLEFVQRFLVRINPDSSKCSAKAQTSRKTGRTVKRKTSDMNPRVISFIRDFTEFDWQN